MKLDSVIVVSESVNVDNHVRLFEFQAVVSRPKITALVDEVGLDGGNYGKMAFQARSNHQNLATRPWRRVTHSNGDAIWL